jgi:hypothetical protein
MAITIQKAVAHLTLITVTVCISILCLMPTYQERVIASALASSNLSPTWTTQQPLMVTKALLC